MLQSFYYLVILGNLSRADHAHHDQLMVLPYRIISCLTPCKKSTSSLFSFLRFCKDIRHLLFQYFGHAWLWTVKIILPACRKLLCLSSSKKPFYPSLLSWNFTKIIQTCYFEYFVHFLIGKEHFLAVNQEQEFCQTIGLQWKVKN